MSHNANFLSSYESSINRENKSPRSNHSEQSISKYLHSETLDLQNALATASAKMMTLGFTSSNSFARHPHTRIAAAMFSIVTHDCFDSIIGFLVLTNAIFIGFQVDYVAAAAGADDNPVFEVAKYAFLVVFTMELVMRLCAFGKGFFFLDAYGWNWFDFIVVTAMLVETAVGTQFPSGQSLAIVRLMRIARILRLMRAFRAASMFRPLRILVNSVISTVRAMFWALVLLLVITYSFAVLFVGAYGEYMSSSPDESTASYESLHLYFGNLPKSLFTLFMSITGGISWEVAVRPLAELDWIYVGLFNAYIIVVLFAVMNVMTGVFCQTAIQSAEQNHEEQIQEELASRKLHTSHLRRLFQEIDQNDSGHFTLNELEDYLSNEKVRAYFSSLQINVSEAWTFFKLLDADGTGSVDIDEFVDGVLRLTGTAKSLDIAIMMKESKMGTKNVMEC